MAQLKMVVKVFAMKDSKTRQKAIAAAADVNGVDSISADLKDQKVTVIGKMDAIKVAKKLIKKLGKIDIISVDPVATHDKMKEETIKQKTTANNKK